MARSERREASGRAPARCIAVSGLSTRVETASGTVGGVWAVMPSVWQISDAAVTGASPRAERLARLLPLYCQDGPQCGLRLCLR